MNVRSNYSVIYLPRQLVYVSAVFIDFKYVETIFLTEHEQP